MIKIHLQKAFFGKDNCLKINFTSENDCYFEFGLPKNNGEKGWKWKPVKFNDIELGDIISVLEGKKIFIYALDKVSSLEDISIYTDSEDIPLVDIYEKLYEIENGKKSIDHKSAPNLLKEKMIEILPDYDQDRVYNSDLKKLFLWYNMLIEAGLLVNNKNGSSSDADDHSDNKD